VPEKISTKGTNFLATINASIVQFIPALRLSVSDNEIKPNGLLYQQQKPH
jgi:hypothetical protein